MTDVMNPPRRRRPGGGPWDGEALRAEFAAAAETKPWTLGYRSINEDRISCIAISKGDLPNDIRGTLYRNGPARHERGGQRYSHAWDGDGMIQQFQFSDRGVSHVGQYVHTEKYLEESRLGRFVQNTFGTAVNPADPTPDRMDASNPANISVIDHGGDLLALWEAGSAYRIQPGTLATTGTKTWSEATVGKPFSAHPRFEADGSMWNFGVDVMAGEITLYHVGADGQILRTHSLAVDRPPPTHDFAVTSRHLVFILPSFVFSKERLLAGASFAQACQWSSATPMRALIVDKHTGSQRCIDVPAGCVFHVANAWEEANGTIHLQYMRAEDPLSLLAGWSVMRGEYVHRAGAKLTALTLRPTAGAFEQSVINDFDAEFPAIEPQSSGLRNGQILCLQRSPGRPLDLPGFDRVAIIDVESESTQHYRYGDEWMAEEHIFISGPDGGRPKWAIGTALNIVTSRTSISVFKSSALASGPVYIAELPYALPLGLHGCFTPSDRR